MALYFNSDGEWLLCQRPYVKYNGIWTACKTAWVKRSGVWVMAYAYDLVPPEIPQITTTLIEDFVTVNGHQDLKTRYIRVGVRMPAVIHDPDVKMIRVLTDYNGEKPTTPFGQTYTSLPDNNWPGEAWSDFKYDAVSGPHKDTSKLYEKQWPRNATDGTQLRGDTNYHFAAWAQDANGNWSQANHTHVNIPKGGVDEPRVRVSETRIYANHSGSWRKNVWAPGNLIQQEAPRTFGLWMYGTQIKDVLTPQDTITNAQIFIVRGNDNGSASAHMYLFWHTYGNPTNLPASGSVLETHQIRFIGDLAKGQYAWFQLPGAFKDDMKAGTVRGMGLWWMNPDHSGANPGDFSVVASIASNYGCGALNLVWEHPL